MSRRRVLILDTEVGCILIKATHSLLLILRSAITTANFQRIATDSQLLAMILEADVTILQPSRADIREEIITFATWCRPFRCLAHPVSPRLALALDTSFLLVDFRRCSYPFPHERTRL